MSIGVTIACSVSFLEAKLDHSSYASFPGQGFSFHRVSQERPPLNILPFYSLIFGFHPTWMLRPSLYSVGRRCKLASLPPVAPRPLFGDFSFRLWLCLLFFLIPLFPPAMRIIKSPRNNAITANPNCYFSWSSIRFFFCLSSSASFWRPSLTSMRLTRGRKREGKINPEENGAECVHEGNKLMNSSMELPGSFSRLNIKAI